MFDVLVFCLCIVELLLNTLGTVSMYHNEEYAVLHIDNCKLHFHLLVTTDSIVNIVTNYFYGFAALHWPL